MAYTPETEPVYTLGSFRFNDRKQVKIREYLPEEIQEDGVESLDGLYLYATCLQGHVRAVCEINIHEDDGLE